MRAVHGLSAFLAASAAIVRAAKPGFVTTQDGQFFLDGKPFNHVATTAYWLAQLSDADLNTTFAAMNATGIKVVRTWAFNDVLEPPADNTTVFFQLLNPNGTATVNTGPNGLQRLDKVLETADAFGMKVQLTLTNNWNPEREANSTLPPGFLSNDYGGMDAYVRSHIPVNGTHDQFFTNQTLINAFQNYLDVVIPRYANSSAVFSWEIANDPRCNSTIANSPSCESRNVTQWVSTISTHVKSKDPDHLVASGAGGFMCIGCPKLFATPTAPTPSPSAGANSRRKRAVPKPLTEARAAQIRSDLLRKWRREAGPDERGAMIRGRWKAPQTRRQSTSQATGLNGAQGVDSQDISAIPQVDIHSFQLFPDQDQYMAVDSPGTDQVTQAIDSGTAWITMQAEAANSANKPAALTAFGLVSQNQTQDFVPFNSTGVTIADVLNNAVKTIGANATQQASAYTQWIQAAVSHGVSSIGQYQWGQTYSSSTSPLITTSPLTPAGSTSQLSPDDGYASFSDTLKSILSNGAAQQTASNG